MLGKIFVFFKICRYYSLDVFFSIITMQSERSRLEQYGSGILSSDANGNLRVGGTLGVTRALGGENSARIDITSGHPF